MQRLFSWLPQRNSTISYLHETPIDRIKRFLVQKRIKEFSSALYSKSTRNACITAYFQVFSIIDDDEYLSNLFNIIQKSSRFSKKELSGLIQAKLISLIDQNEFIIIERLLRLTSPSSAVSLPPVEMMRWIHKVHDRQQLFRCLSMLIDKNLPHDSEYLSWMLIIILEFYVEGDEDVIEFIIKDKFQQHSLHVPYGPNQVTPLMLFLHLYGNLKCQQLLNEYFQVFADQTILCKSDRWNRSYLNHLLCGQCRHEPFNDAANALSNNYVEIDSVVFNICPNAREVIARFVMFYQLAVPLDQPIKAIFNSQYCLPLRFLLCAYAVRLTNFQSSENHQFFLYLPSTVFPSYSKYVEQILDQHDLDSSLQLLIDQNDSDRNNFAKIEFLLQCGATLTRNSHNSERILHFILQTNSRVPFLLLNYSIFAEIPSSSWPRIIPKRLILYACLLMYADFPTEFREKFNQFKSQISPPLSSQMEKCINTKFPKTLLHISIGKLRYSLKNSGKKTMNELKGELPTRIHQMLCNFGQYQCVKFSEILEV